MSDKITKKPLGEQITIGWQEVENGYLVEGMRNSSIEDRNGKRVVRIASDRSAVKQASSLIYDQLSM